MVAVEFEGDSMSDGVVIAGLDIIDILRFIQKKNRKFQAVFLSDLEEILSPDTPEYEAVRKLYLDAQNNYTRSILRAIFGDVEHLMK